MTNIEKIRENRKNRIREALDLRGMKQADLCRMTGISKSSMSGYVSGRDDPKQDKIYAMAQVLGVNPAWLYGFSDEREPRENMPVSSAERRMIVDFRKLDETDKVRLLERLSVLLEGEKYHKGGSANVG